MTPERAGNLYQIIVLNGLSPAFLTLGGTGIKLEKTRLQQTNDVTQKIRILLAE